MKISELLTRKGPHDKLLKACESLPFEEILTTPEMAKKVGVSPSQLKHFGRHDDLIPNKYRQNSGALTYWGSAKTISALKKRMSER